jgi:hypothetical protein
MGVDLTTGARSVFASQAVPIPGNPLIDPTAFALDASRDRAIVADAGMQEVVVVDLATGLAQPVPMGSAGAIAMPLRAIEGVAVDASRNVAYLTNPEYVAVQAVDLVTGERVFVSP